MNVSHGNGKKIPLDNIKTQNYQRVALLSFNVFLGKAKYWWRNCSNVVEINKFLCNLVSKFWYAIYFQCFNLIDPNFVASRFSRESLILDNIRAGFSDRDKILLSDLYRMTNCYQLFIVLSKKSRLDLFTISDITWIIKLLSTVGWIAYLCRHTCTISTF